MQRLVPLGLVGRPLVVNVLAVAGIWRAGFRLEGLLSLALFDFWYLVELVLQSRHASSHAAEHDRGSRQAMVAVRDFALLAPTWYAALVPPAVNLLLLAVGVCIGLAGLYLRFMAMRALARYFTMSLTDQAEHQLLTSGPYQHIRHPGYFGLVLIYCSFSLMYDVPCLTLVVLLASLAAVAYRVRLEERLLLQRFGDAYASYRENTWVLVPHIW